MFTGLSWYVAPDGNSRGNGSRLRPWDIVTAFSGPRNVLPGDVIWLLPGTYELDRTLVAELKGASGEPVVVRGEPGRAAVVLDFTKNRERVALRLRGAHATYSDFEITNVSEERVSLEPGDAGDPRGTGVLGEQGLGVELVRLKVSNFGTSLFESRASGLVVYGCEFSNSYWEGPDRTHGPGLYLRNPSGAPRKRVENCFVFQHGRQGLQGYGSTPFAEMDIVGNVFFNNGVGSDGFHRNIMFGNAGDQHTEVVFEHNVAFLAEGGARGDQFNLFGGVGGSNGLRIVDNTIAHPGRPALFVQRANGMSMSGNRVVGGITLTSGDGVTVSTDAEVQSEYPENTYYFNNRRPVETWTHVRRNERIPDAWDRRYELHVAVLNWKRKAFVGVDLQAEELAGRIVSGAVVRVRSVQHPEEERVGVYRDGVVEVPMTGWPEPRAHGRDPSTNPLPPTFPLFGGFHLDWEAEGNAASRNPDPLEDPGLGLPREDARLAREVVWAEADPDARAKLRVERSRAWRAAAEQLRHYGAASVS